MSLLNYYRESYEYEKDCNQKMLGMLESVPEANRTDPRFQRALTLAGHLAACRENWLDHMAGDGTCQVPWFDDGCDFATLLGRFAELERRWTEYLASLNEGDLAATFSFPVSETERFSLLTKVQIVQLIGHAHYHRGQVALLVDLLGGETVDTDYADWWWFRNHDVQ